MNITKSNTLDSKHISDVAHYANNCPNIMKTFSERDRFVAFNELAKYGFEPLIIGKSPIGVTSGGIMRPSLRYPDITISEVSIDGFVFEAIINNKSETLFDSRLYFSDQPVAISQFRQNKTSGFSSDRNLKVSYEIIPEAAKIVGTNLLEFEWLPAIANFHINRDLLISKPEMIETIFAYSWMNRADRKLPTRLDVVVCQPDAKPIRIGNRSSFDLYLMVNWILTGDSTGISDSLVREYSEYFRWFEKLRLIWEFRKMAFRNISLFKRLTIISTAHLYGLNITLADAISKYGFLFEDAVVLQELYVKAARLISVLLPKKIENRFYKR